MKFGKAAPSMPSQRGLIVHRPRQFAENHLDFVDSFKPINYFLRILGLMPFSIGRTSNGNISAPEIKKIDGLWFLLTISIYSIVAIASFEYVKFKRESNLHLHMVEVSHHYLHLTMGLIFSVVFIGMDMYNRYNLVDLLKKFTIFDKEVSHFFSCSFQSYTLNDSVINF